jgi:Family of unknown function (DUF6065)
VGEDVSGPEVEFSCQSRPTTEDGLATGRDGVRTHDGTDDRLDDDAGIPLAGYYLQHDSTANMPLVAAPKRRQWMNDSPARRPYYCLPMALANQAGWFLLNTHTFKVRWSGEDGVDSLAIYYLTGQRPFPASSTFGSGILTFQIPYLFRTPPGYNILVRGPANCPKDGAYPLEGLVEADWSTATFTMNWQLTRPNHTVVFEEHEPIAMIVPQIRGALENFRPELAPIETDEDLSARYSQWAQSRRDFIAAVRTHPTDVDTNGMLQRHYYQGVSVDGTPAPEHQRSLRLHPFREMEAEAEADEV